MIRQWSYGWAGMLIGALIAAAFCTSADARDMPLQQATQRRAYIVVPDAKPARVVTRYMARQHDVKVVRTVVNHQSHDVDLDANYGRQGQFRIDDDHWLLKAQRLGKAATAGKAKVIFGKVRTVQTVRETRPQPRLIIQKPDGIAPRHHDPKKSPKRRFPGQWVHAD